MITSTASAWARLPRGLQQLPASRRRLLAVAAAAGLLLVALAAVLSYNLRQCAPAAGDISTVQRFLAQSRWREASSLADAVLRRDGPRLCTDARQTLAVAGYRARIAGILAKPHQSGNVEEHRTAVQQWRDAGALAEQYAIPPSERVSALQIVERAYNAGYWLLSREAWLAAWRSGAMPARDSNALASYFSSLRNLGVELATVAPEEYHADGLAALHTAVQVAEAFGLPRGEATADLLRLVGERSRWPAPAADPLLAARQAGDLPPAR